MREIVGYVGSRQAAPILPEGLKKLKYRGYDSTGIAARDGNKEPIVVEAKGRLRILADKTDNGRAPKGCCGTGHTRWATHDVPSETSVYPHVSTDGSVLTVHSGIFENYLGIREKLARHNYRFYSQTDAEAIVNLADYYYRKHKVGSIDAIAKTLVRVCSSYALAIMFRDYPEQTYITRKDNPLIMGLGEDKNLITSDPSTYLKYACRVCYIDDLEMGCVTKDSVTFYDLNDDVIEKTPMLINQDKTATGKGGYEHFVMREIHEQPKAIAGTFRTYLGDKTGGKKLDYRVDFARLGLTDELVQSLSGVTTIGCGSAYHVGAMTQYVIEGPAKLSVRAEFTSEYRYRHPVVDPDDLVVMISQSDETTDTLATMRETEEQGLKTLTIVNVIGSVIAHEADLVPYTYAGLEISVATTKVYSTRLIGVYLLAICLGKARGLIDEHERQRLLAEIAALPEKVQRIVDNKGRLQWFATKFSNAKDVFFIDHGVNYAIRMEGSLKVKEIDHVRSETYAAGELKHGTISLIEDDTLVTGVLTQSELYEKTLSNLVEVKSYSVYLIGLATSGSYNIEDAVNFAFFLPETDGHFADNLAVVPLQLLGYHLAASKRLDVGKPRDLAKSVTVEWT